MTAVRRLILLICAAAALPLFAQSTEAPPAATPPVTADTDQDVKNPRAMPLALDEAIRTSLKQNLGVDLERYSYAEAAEDLAGTYGIFDIYTNATLRKSRSEGATLSAFDASSQGATTADVSASQILPTGGSYTLSWDNQRSTRAGFGTTLSPGYSTSLGFGFTQPLARNFGVDITRRNINLARNTLGIDREIFRSALLDTTNATEQAYLDLVYARQYVDVVKEAVFLARDQSRITQIRIDVGASAPLDILQPRVQIATTEEQLIAAIADVRAAEDRLRQLMNLPASEWDRPIIPTDKIGYSAMSIDVGQAVAKAFDLRPEIRENKLATENRRITYNYARNQVLPQVDFTTGYSLQGAAGRALDPNTGLPIGGVQTSFPDAFSQVLRRDFPGWNVGLNIGVPVFNIAARAEARRAKLDLDRSNVLESQTRQTVTVDVRATARAIDTAAKEITASRAAREAAEQNLDAERKRYENGMTTNFQVLQIQQQLSDARARELQSLVAYNKAVTAFHRAVGDLLDVRNITTEAPAATGEPSMFTRWDRYNWLNFSAHDNTKEDEYK